MEVKVIEESGYAAALFGVGLSYGLTSGRKCFPSEIYKYDQWERHGGNPEPYKEEEAIFKRMEGIARKLAHKGNAENKFLRQICVTLDVEAPFYFHKQLSTYKVGTVAQSESTMHTLTRTPITQDRFEHPIFPDTLNHLESLRQCGEFEQLINELPCGWLQRRILSCNYAVLQNIYNQRRHHKLKEWHVFIDAVLEDLWHPEFIKKEEADD